ncbi:AAA family ATPase [Parabacteroides gordonii]|jgi:hypothetical protein|uniref:AAA family ATPase n=1 Tax=Parabacteroides gordonii TaxID=574930 RepID=UPI00241F0DCE|nr:AAA family ATPase [Parabacteroides gordonii]
MDRKKLPIGISDYKRLIDEDYYYVDKTDFIRQIVEDGSLITMLPRPRRFGKTLNLSTLRYFFEKTEGDVYRPLFKGKSVERWKDFDKYQGKYPVIMVTLKDCKADTFEEVLLLLAHAMQTECIRHGYLREHIRQEDYLDQFIRLQNRKATPDELAVSLSLLSELLTDYWGTSPLVLLDEYDTPIHVAYDKGYYDKMIGFMRNFMSAVFKDNTDIFRGVITGILRVSKESIFSGLNNIDVDTILEEPMCTSFGFTQEETDRMLDDYSMSNLKDEVKQWYDGYLFGNQTIYNPWSVLSFISKGGVLAPYWVNTGSDVLLRHLLAEGPSQIRDGVEALIQGDPVRSVINDKLAFPDLLAKPANIWSFMLFSGYLKASDPVLTPEDLIEYTLQVPNREVKTVFRTIIQSWIDNGPVKNDRLERMLQALGENNMPIFQRLLNDFVVNTLSYYDTSGRDPEKVYQAFLLGMLVSSGAYEVISNRESGLGRYDILMRPRNIQKRGVIMELKLYDPMFDKSVDDVLDSALQQIEDKRYEATFRAAGVADILKMAITFDGKRVWIKTVDE